MQGEVLKGVRTSQAKDVIVILTNLECFHSLIPVVTKQGTSYWQVTEKPDLCCQPCFQPEIEQDNLQRVPYNLNFAGIVTSR